MKNARNFLTPPEVPRPLADAVPLPGANTLLESMMRKARATSSWREAELDQDDAGAPGMSQAAIAICGAHALVSLAKSAYAGGNERTLLMITDAIGLLHTIVRDLQGAELDADARSVIERHNAQAMLSLATLQSSLRRAGFTPGNAS